MPSPIKLINIRPNKIVVYGKNRILVDYGKVWFAKVKITPNFVNYSNTIVVRLRESSNKDPLPSNGDEPIGVRFYETKATFDKSIVDPEIQTTS